MLTENMGQIYPRLEVNLAHLRHNVEEVVRRCGAQGIQIAGVIKGATGLPAVAKQFDAGGAAFIASSRLEQLEDARNAGITKPLMLIRIPMLTEVPRVVRLTDISLNSEMKVIEALNREAEKQNRRHRIILMADMGDLREGFWDKEEMAEAAVHIEKDLSHLELAGIGTNLGCYGAIAPTREILEDLVSIAETIEARIGRKLEYISGGATTSLMRVWDGDMPQRINLLRVGEGILLAQALQDYFNYDMSMLYRDTFRLKAEVIEVKDKPSHPVGTITIDAFNHRPTYVDRGIRRRALLGMGKVDYGDPSELIPLEKGIEILGASSDHTIVDIECAEKQYEVGDIMEFEVTYATIVYLSNCRNVAVVYV